MIELSQKTTQDGSTSRPRFQVAISRAQVRSPLHLALCQMARRKGWQLVTTANPNSEAEGVFLLSELPPEITNQFVHDTPTIAIRMNAGPGMSQVSIDEEKAGKTGAEHLMNRGFKHFAFVQITGTKGERQLAGFQSAVEGEDFHSYMIQTRNDVARTAELLQGLPRPLGVMVSSDAFAAVIAEEITAQRIAVPREIAIVGSDNDWHYSELSSPIQLSSVQVDEGQIAEQAGNLMLDLVNGTAKSGTTVTISPGDVVTRDSTDTIVAKHEKVAAALEYVRQHYTDNGLTAGILAKHVGMSRQGLSNAFLSNLGKGPGETIQCIRLEKFKRLLITTDISIADLAKSTGYMASQNLHTIFKRRTGMTPNEYRSMFQAQH